MKLLPAYWAKSPVYPQEEQKSSGIFLIILNNIKRVINDFFSSKLSNNREWTIHCEYCTKNVRCNVDPGAPCATNAHDNIFNAYFKLFTSTNDCIRLNMSKNILSFSNHVKSFNTNEVAKKWLFYIHDNNAEIRSNIASVIGQLLSNKISMSESSNAHLPDTVSDDLDQFVDLTIDVIANALTIALNTSNHSLHDTLLITCKNFIW